MEQQQELTVSEDFLRNARVNFRKLILEENGAGYSKPDLWKFFTEHKGAEEFPTMLGESISFGMFLACRYLVDQGCDADDMQSIYRNLKEKVLDEVLGSLEPLIAQAVGLSFPAVCLTCGCRDNTGAQNEEEFENLQVGYCRNGHDDWLEIVDFEDLNSETIQRAEKVFGIKADELLQVLVTQPETILAVKV